MMALFGMAIVLIGIYGLMTQKHALKLIVSLNVLEVGINLLIVAIGFVEGGLAPLLTKEAPSSSALFVDPLPQALVLTAIVIGVGTTALGLAIARKLFLKYGTYMIDEMGVE